jgi:hypothetical protein
MVGATVDVGYHRFFSGLRSPTGFGRGAMEDLQHPMIDLVPKPTPDVEMEVVEGEVLLYHPSQTRAVYLNPTAAVIWGLSDGKRTVREIIRAIADFYPEAAMTLSDDVLMTLKELQENGVLVVS